MTNDDHKAENLKTRDRPNDEPTPVGREDSYVHYTPAVRFGDSLATLERYRGKTWAEIEPEARREWEEKQERPWEEFREIVRQAWEKVRPQFSDEIETPPKDPETYETAFRRHYEANFAGSDYAFSQCALAYHYGYDLAVDERLRHKTWAEIEPEARRYWQTEGPPGSWDELKEAVRYAWNEVRD